MGRQVRDRKWLRPLRPFLAPNFQPPEHSPVVDKERRQRHSEFGVVTSSHQLLYPSSPFTIPDWKPGLCPCPRPNPGSSHQHTPCPYPPRLSDFGGPVSLPLAPGRTPGWKGKKSIREGVGTLQGGRVQSPSYNPSWWLGVI